MKALAPLIERHKEAKQMQPASLRKALFHGPRSGGLGLVRDLHDLRLPAQEVSLCYVLRTQAGLSLRDDAMLTILQQVSKQTARQIDWLRTRIDQAGPQALVVPS